ncbi:hypothetical protein D3C72_790580 [compost metagenome]
MPRKRHQFLYLRISLRLISYCLQDLFTSMDFLQRILFIQKQVYLLVTEVIVYTMSPLGILFQELQNNLDITII